jgi:O-antigen/teichoic acid export membrane protein
MAIPFELNRSKIVGSIATLFSGSVVAQGMTALALLLTARQLKVDGYGQYAACITITSMLSILFSLGLDIWLLREGGRVPHELADFAGSLLSIKAVFGLIWVMVLFLLAPKLNQGSFPANLFRWSVVLIWSDTLLGTCLTAFKASLHNRTPSILEAGADTIWFGLTLLLIGLGIRQPESYLRIRVFVSVIALMLALLILARRFGLHFNLTIVRRALTESFPFTASEFLAMITMRADVVIISLTLGSTATGLYSPSVGLVNMAFLAPMAIYLVMVPVLSNLYQNNPQQARKTALRSIGLSLLLGIGLTLVFSFGSPLVITLLGSSYTGSVEILRILSWVLLFKCSSFAMAAILVATDQQVNRTSVQVVAAAVNIIMNLIVVYWIGINGVAIVYVLTEMILLVGYSWYVWRKK